MQLPEHAPLYFTSEHSLALLALLPDNPTQADWRDAARQLGPKGWALRIAARALIDATDAGSVPALKRIELLAAIKAAL